VTHHDLAIARFRSLCHDHNRGEVTEQTFS
jgi:hypothetical protein